LWITFFVDPDYCSEFCLTSRWYYPCIHVIISIPKFKTKTKIADYLKLPFEVVSNVLNFLELKGLAINFNGRYEIGLKHLHLGHDSLHATKNHFNWRTKALASLDLPKPNDLHCSSVGTLSQTDAVKIIGIDYFQI
jgi:hypothetical protein